ncbi:MAG: hypothetical protein ACTILG_03585 [Sphingobacterium sp.]
MTSSTIILQAGTGGIPSLIPLLISLAFLVAIFFVFRGIFLWYWKINQIVNQQKEQIEWMNYIASKLDQIAKNTSKEKDQ